MTRTHNAREDVDAAARNPSRTVPFARALIDDDDIAEVTDALRSGWITTGPKVHEFEERFARRLGVKHAVALNSATAALHLALDAAGLRSGDEVIVPTITFTASAEVVRYFDAKPVLVDVQKDTLCVDPAAIRRTLTPRTKAIIPVHMGGHPADMDEILGIAAEHGLVVIEDAAHALPCKLGGRDAGTIGHMGAFSFYATKTITTGEGGMLVTDNDAFAERARLMALHGMSRDSWNRYSVGGSWRYDVLAPGFKYNMTDIAGALGLSQLRKADSMWERRVDIARQYTSAFGPYPELEPPVSRPGILHSWHLYVLRLMPSLLRITRDAFLHELSKRGVSTSVHFIPVHTFSYYRETFDYEDADFPVACGEFNRMLSLPIYPAMTPADVEFVIETVTDLITRHRL